MWASIGGAHLTYFAGDANCRVEPGAHTITWKPRKAWPDNEVKENMKVVVSAWATNAPPDYMAVSLLVGGQKRFYTHADAVPFGVTNDLYKTEWMLFRKCPAANVTWRMGSPSTELGRSENGTETPRLVTLDEDYYMGIYPVTQRQLQLAVTSRGHASTFNLASDYATRPVDNISYEMLRGSVANGANWPDNGHAVEPDWSFLSFLRARMRLGDLDLPTEAQWEFACRAGCGTALYNGQELDDETTSARAGALGRYRGNGGYVNGVTEPSSSCTAENGTAKVGSYAPNAWGLYDMLGNMWEWCLDWEASASGSRVIRGGGWDSKAKSLRSACHSWVAPDYRDSTCGFRLACSAVIP